MPPAEAEARHDEQLELAALAACPKQNSLRQIRGGSVRGVSESSIAIPGRVKTL
jgi:hypothetical protein